MKSKGKLSKFKPIKYPLYGPGSANGLKLSYEDYFSYRPDTFINTLKYHLGYQLPIFAANSMVNDFVFYALFNHTIPSGDFFGMPIYFHAPHEMIFDRADHYYTTSRYVSRYLVTPRIVVYDETFDDFDADE